jgi:broad specificity phosphatase PhoE
MRISILLAIISCCIIGSAQVPGKETGYILFLVRHAEKQVDGSHDPGLTETGKKRSIQLANWFADKNIREIWSSDYRRTRNTATPLLSRLGIELGIYDPGDQVSLAANLLQRQNNALVVGHSNTIPQLARLICRCLISDMDKSEHDRLIAISVNGAEIRVRTLRQSHSFQPQNQSDY